jgi:hypothetical protein
LLHAVAVLEPRPAVLLLDQRLVVQQRPDEGAGIGADASVTVIPDGVGVIVRAAK